MGFQHKNFTGSLFKNSKKEKDNHPDVRGSCMIDGKKYWISGWEKVGRDTGEIWQSLVFNPADDVDRPSNTVRTPPPAKAQERELEEEVPFHG